MNIQISGNLNGPTAFFIAGWPDTCDIYRDNIMATLGAEYRLVGLTIPGFDDEHPCLQLMREKGLGNAFSGSCSAGPGGATASAHAAANADDSWLSNIFPFSYSRAAAAQRSSLVNKLPLSCGRPPCEMFRTTWRGHSFQDLVTMLEIAVDTAMETCNYCPDTIPSAATASPPPGRRTTSGTATTQPAARTKTRGGPVAAGEKGVEGVPLHQLPPTYTRPVLIAHDWGCFLAYELLLIRPDFFSRFVALDIGGYVFESNAAHVEKMCELVSRNEKSRRVPPTAPAGSPPRTPGAVLSPHFDQVRAGTHPSTETTTGDAESAGGPSLPTCVWPLHNSGEGGAEYGSTSIPTISQPVELQRQRTSHSRNSPQETTTSSPLTVVHGVAPGARLPTAASTHFDGLTPSVSNISQLRNSVSGAATKRSLASQYAIRRKKPTPQTERAERWKGLAIVAYQWFLIVCTVLLPSRLARWLTNCFATLIRRPTYYYDPQMVLTPAVELLNRTLNAQFFAQHPYALENRAAFDLPVLLQVQEGAHPGGRRADASLPSINLEHPGLMPGAPALRLLPGWKFMLIPCVEGSPVSLDEAQRLGLHGGDGKVDASAPQSPLPLNSRRRYEKRDGGSGRLRSRCSISSTRGSDRVHRSFYQGSSTSTDMSCDDASQSLDRDPVAYDAMGSGKASCAGAPGISGASGGAASSTEAGHTIYSSYTKGASLFEEWHRPGDGSGRVAASAASSGELDPYRSVLSIPQPLWVGEDPLALTGARSFQEPRRGGIHDSEDYFLIAPDCDEPPRRNPAASVAAGTAPPPASHTQVIKRRIFYQAVAFPPLRAPGNGSLSSLNGDAVTAAAPNSGDDCGGSIRSTQSTMLSRLRRNHRKSAQRPSVPVLVSPLQGWVYVRYWLGMLLMCVMAFGSWLLGEKRPAPSSAASDNSAVSSAGKAYSNVMTTAMTTIYRRLPATPSLASSTANLPGDGDVVLQPQSYSPLVSQRFFVPLPIPVLYMYGGDKKLMFHADHWCSYVRQYQRSRDGISDVVEVQGGGHWFYAEKKYQKKVADRIAEFLAAEQMAPPGL